MGTSHLGTGASDGLFIGPVRRLGQAAADRQGTGHADTERAALQDAIASAIAGLTTLLARVEGEAQDILGFQVAMLEDDALSAPALSAIDSGTPAHDAWASALDSEIAGYEASDDEYFITGFIKLI
ncbi:phosphoenolpyruvate-utilizing N-terminal domain-containing protein [Aestuariivirga sp.]|uniref:phosphoenolpyruvate-utilizing N-terminal domain-containing protein n=1 Tax=Aestuariivirga sp. TaxID=2650926 RepID=UPI003016FE0C